MKQLFFRGGKPFVADVPPPGLPRGQVLVDLRASAVSPGTELSVLEESGRSFLARAIEKRRRVDRLFDAVRRRDLSDLRLRFERLRTRGDAWIAAGYSAAGVVRAAGDGVRDFAPGDRVALAGAGSASHAEQVSVPRNLVVQIPEGVRFEQASTVALGAIALQSVRRAGTVVGETVLVLGLGILGQLTARIVLASGARVLAWDPDPARLALAREAGNEVLTLQSAKELPAQVAARTAGRGADQVILAAAAGAESVAHAAACVRRAGRLVLLGNTPVSMPRDVAYERELTILMSTSYGPGRYDPTYEDAGLDYPFAYVRWTENRNMAGYLDLLARGRVRIEDLLHEVDGLDAAAEAYLSLRSGRAAPGLVFRYPAAAGAHAPVRRELPRTIAPSLAPRGTLQKPVRLAVVGTGGYTRSSLLPELRRLGDAVRLEWIVGNAPSRREPLAQEFGAKRTTADIEVVLADPDVDLVVIATRHDLHARQVESALRAGKAVYCEKPLALDAVGLDAVEAASPGTFLTLGFNRRFAPTTVVARNLLRDRRGPLQIAYRVQAGALAEGHWLRGSEGGGRLIGEAVHMIDLARTLVGSPLSRVACFAGGAGPDGDPAADDFHLLLGYEDGSTCCVLYTARGAPAHPKERIELHWDGRSAEIDNFQTLHESGRAEPLVRSSIPDKGQRGLMDAVFAALLAGAPSPTPIEEVLETSRAALELEAMRAGRR